MSYTLEQLASDIRGTLTTEPGESGKQTLCRALSEENSEYSWWSWTPWINPEKSREINGSEIRSRRAGKVFNFSLTMPF